MVEFKDILKYTVIGSVIGALIINIILVAMISILKSNLQTLNLTNLVTFCYVYGLHP